MILENKWYFINSQFTTLDQSPIKIRIWIILSHDTLFCRLQNYLLIFFNTSMISISWAKFSSHYSYNSARIKVEISDGSRHLFPYSF